MPGQKGKKKNPLLTSGNSLLSGLMIPAAPTTGGLYQPGGGGGY